MTLSVKGMTNEAPKKPDWFQGLRAGETGDLDEKKKRRLRTEGAKGDG